MMISLTIVECVLLLVGSFIMVLGGCVIARCLLGPERGPYVAPVTRDLPEDEDEWDFTRGGRR